MTDPDFAAKEAAWADSRLNQHLAQIERWVAEFQVWEAHAIAEDLDVDDEEAMRAWLDDCAQDAMEAAAERQAEMRAEDW